MRLNVNKLLHTPEAQEEVRFDMDLSDLDFGGSKPGCCGLPAAE